MSGLKLWDKGISIDAEIERYTIGKDREMDMFLARYDVLGTIAHIIMLSEVGLLDKTELIPLKQELSNIYHSILAGDFVIEEGVEDVHSQVEMLLTQRLGDIGKKVHSGRSRNDQVLVDIKLYLRQAVKELFLLTEQFFDSLQTQSEKYKDILIPGYTHLQVAMPSSFGLWFGAYAETLIDDLQLMKAAWEVSNRNPLGSAAGYGSSFPLNRTLTTQLLGFDDMSYNVVAAQMGRGKTEKTLAYAMSAIASTVARFSMDACMFTSQNFGFIKLPDNLTTGSSIMPHKKNPDVFELTRAKSNKIQSLPSEITLLINNLPSGYFRDYQLLKEILFPAIEELKDILSMMIYVTDKIEVKENILDDDRYKYIFSVEEVNRKVVSGVPFRDAYRQVGEQIQRGEFVPNKTVIHTHEGSIGNLCTKQISEKMALLKSQMSFNKADKALMNLIQ